MKKTIIILAILLLSGIGNINAQQVTNTENQRLITHVIGNHYDVLVMDSVGEIVQEGQYFKIDDKLKEHGIWRLYDSNTYELVTKAKYDKGTQIWVETRIDGKLIRVNQQELQLKRAQEGIVALETKIESE